MSVCGRIAHLRWGALVMALWAGGLATPVLASHQVPPFADLVAYEVRLKPELQHVHPRVFVTASELDDLRRRSRTSHNREWQQVLANLAALKGSPPPAPGPQARRSQNNVAFAIAEISFAYQIERNPVYLEAARRWVLAAIQYEPWGYTYNKPNVDLAAGHLLYAIGWAYDLLYHELTEEERGRIRASLERHAVLVSDYFSPAAGKTFNFTQNHNFIPTAGLAVAALALIGESQDAPRWAALARAHHHRAGMLLGPDGYYYEGFEYWIFSAPWLVHFLDAWEHTTGESLWDREVFRNWKLYLSHALLPDGQNVFDFGDIWEGPLTRARQGVEYDRVFPRGTLQSNYNVMYRLASRLRDRQAQAVAERFARFGHSNLEEFWTLIWRDDALTAAPIEELPLGHHFEDSGVAFYRTSWQADATAFAFKAGPPEGHRVRRMLDVVPEWKLSDGHAHPDANSFIIYARYAYLTGDTGYAGLPAARHHNTITVGGLGQGLEGKHDVWSGMTYAELSRIRIVEATFTPTGARVVGEAAAAYPREAGLRMFTRTFTFQMPDRFTISDTVQTDAPRVIQWYLHADSPVEVRDRSFNVRLGDTLLRGSVRCSEPARLAAGSTRLASPGQPGSIEKGPAEARGFELIVETREPRTFVSFEAQMRVQADPRRR